jgi:alkylation response protein AidB-like acyl-CoA dehydrogenase
MIDFEIPEDDRMLLDSIDRMMARHFPPALIREHDDQHRQPLHMVPLMAELGLFALPLPEEYDGLGKDWRSVVLAVERMAYRGDIGTLLATSMTFGGSSLLMFGSEAQKATLLPRLAKGQALFSLALTEPGAGSDAAAIVTSARRTATGWRVNGRKTWISNANSADYLVLLCHFLILFSDHSLQAAGATWQALDKTNRETAADRGDRVRHMALRADKRRP